MTCAYFDCDAETSIERRYLPEDTIYSYCDEHDPLSDESLVDDAFVAVGE